MRWDVDKQTVTIIYQIHGKGTAALAGVAQGVKVDAILPIGRGFYLTAKEKNVFLIGGGVGIAPLLTVVRKWPDKRYEAFLGYRGRDFEYCLKDFEEACEKVFVATDDGTLGRKGVVGDIVRERLEETKPDAILICGPPAMLRALKELIIPTGIPAQVSMEQRMCCGFGACSVCVCGIEEQDGLAYKKTCIEGPVFESV